MKYIKFMGLMFSLLMLVAFLPAVSAAGDRSELDDCIEVEKGLRPQCKYALVFGRLAEARQIGSLIIGKADRLSYIGMNYEGGLDYARVKNKIVVFWETPQLNAWTIGNYVYITGSVLKLRIL